MSPFFHSTFLFRILEIFQFLLLLQTTYLVNIAEKGMLATHILTQTFQHTLFDWLKFTSVPPNHVGPI